MTCEHPSSAKYKNGLGEICIKCDPSLFVEAPRRPYYDPRPTWDEYYLGIAKAVSVRADCTRRKIGAILVNAHNRHRGSGYNGGRSKGPSCIQGECPRGRTNVVAPGSSYDTGEGACVAIHAEQNLCLETTPEERRDGTIYITDEPCDGCLRMLKGSGVIRIVWPDGEWKKFSERMWVKNA